MQGKSFDYVRDWKADYNTKGWWHSFDLPDGRHLTGVCSVEGLRRRIEQFPIPADLRGARVLDIGTWDGWYAFEMERRGADVMAVDCWDNPRFHEMRHLLNSRVDYRQMDVYDLTPDTVGRFDIVLFMGVLYHLKHPLLALERVCAITTDMAAVDSFILREEHRPNEGFDQRPVMEFYETDEFGGQTDNWCGPSLPCLMAMCRTAGFARVEHKATLPDGACIACYRKWAPVSNAAEQAPELLAAFHHVNHGLNFQSRYDEYATALFTFAENVHTVEPQVSELGVKPIHVSRRDSGQWQANFKLPPGLPAGWHDVTIRVNGAVSNPIRIAVDVPLAADSIEIRSVADGKSWEPGLLRADRGTTLTAWISGLPANADRANVKAFLSGQPLAVAFVGQQDGNGVRQINLEVPADVPQGRMDLVVSIGPVKSPAAELVVTREFNPALSKVPI